MNCLESAKIIVEQSGDCFEQKFIQCIDCPAYQYGNSCMHFWDNDNNKKILWFKKYIVENEIKSKPKIEDIPQKEKNTIEHPQHYTAGKFETIEIIRDQVQDIKSYLHGNCIKYLSRYRHKNGVEDLKKCKQYLEWLIKECEK